MPKTSNPFDEQKRKHVPTAPSDSTLNRKNGRPLRQGSLGQGGVFSPKHLRSSSSPTSSLSLPDLGKQPTCLYSMSTGPANGVSVDIEYKHVGCFPRSGSD